MNQSARRTVGLALLLGLLLTGCSRSPSTEPVVDQPSSSNPRQPVVLQSGELLPVEQRPAVSQFTAVELESGDEHEFPTAGRVAVYSFFSPG